MQDNATEKQRLRVELLFCFLLLVLMIVFFIMCQGYPLDARRAPLVIMIPLTLLILSQIVRLGKRFLAIRSVVKSEVKSFYEQITMKKNIKSYLLLVWLIIFILLINVVGLVLGMAIFLIFSLRFVSGERWLLSLAVGVAVPAVIYLVFQVLLHIILFPGLIQRYI